eukprot:1183751-Prorocentrum_minimum.AAC.12
MPPPIGSRPEVYPPVPPPIGSRPEVYPPVPPPIGSRPERDAVDGSALAAVEVLDVLARAGAIQPHQLAVLLNHAQLVDRAPDVDNLLHRLLLVQPLGEPGG